VSEDALLRTLLIELEAELPAAVELRHRLHAAPDLSHQEEPTALAVEAALIPLPVTRLEGAARLAEAGRGDHPVVVRAELDGLPLREKTAAVFASLNGRMHACGHDVHMAALVALCRAASRLGDRLPRPLVALFQHSEEAYPSGARELRDSRRLAAARPHAIVGVHVHPGVPWGEVAADPGAVNAAADSLRILIRGEGGHAAYPHLSADPVLALSSVVVALQQVVSRRLDPLHSAVLTVSSVEAGNADNVLPDEARAAGTLRTMQPEDRASLRAAVEEIATSVARAHACEAQVTFVDGEPEVTNDPELTRRFRALAPAARLTPARPVRSCGADDFGYYGALAPALMAFCGVARDAGGVPLHHPRFLPPDDAVELVARAQAAAYAAACGMTRTEPAP
jgi:amidohydrolase